MERGRYYDSPQISYRKRTFHLFDFLMIAVIVAVVLLVLPIDFRTGLNGTSAVRQAEIDRRLDGETLPGRYVERLFRTSAADRRLQRGVKDERYTRTEFPWGKGYLKERGPSAAFFQLMRPAPLCWFINGVQLGAEAERVYYYADDMGGWVEDPQVGSMFLRDGKVDPQPVLEVLSRDRTGGITLREAAGLMQLINSGVLVGFSGETAWFCTETADGYPEVTGYALDGSRVGESVVLYRAEIGVYVIDDTYLIADENGMIHLRNLRTGDRSNVVLEGRLAGLEYAIRENGEVYILFITREKPAYGAFRLTGEGVRYEKGTLESLESEPEAIQAYPDGSMIYCTVYCEKGSVYFSR